MGGFRRRFGSGGLKPTVPGDCSEYTTLPPPGWQGPEILQPMLPGLIHLPLPVLRGRAGVGVNSRGVLEETPTLTLPRSTGRGNKKDPSRLPRIGGRHFLGLL